MCKNSLKYLHASTILNSLEILILNDTNITVPYEKNMVIKQIFPELSLKKCKKISGKDIQKYLNNILT